MPLLDWYDARAPRSALAISRRARRADPYRVWLSEIMLQQTDGQGRHPLLPRVPRALADGRGARRAPARRRARRLGRARLLQPRAQPAQVRASGRCASTAAVFPTTRRSCATLPGIGPYTAAAIAAIAFGAQVDAGRRQRRAGGRAPVRGRGSRCRPPSAELKRLAATLTPAQRAGDFAQAMMDLGATHLHAEAAVVPDVPAAAGSATASAQGIEATLPRKADKAARPERVRPSPSWRCARTATCCCASGPSRACSRGMLEVPGDRVADELLPAVEGGAARGAGAGRLVAGAGRRQRTSSRTSGWSSWSTARWCRPMRADLLGRRPTLPLGARAAISPIRPLPSVMRKIIAHALKEM